MSDAATRIEMVMRARALVFGGTALWLEAQAAELPQGNIGRATLERAARRMREAAGQPSPETIDLAGAMREALSFHADMATALGTADSDPPRWVKLFRAALAVTP